MTTVEIKKHHRQALIDICEQFGVFPTIRYGQSKFTKRKETVIKCTLSETISKDWKIVTQHIMSFKHEEDRKAYATVYYALYSCNLLILKNHPYPQCKDWRREFGFGMELDHKMPKWAFPELTFDSSNWQPLTSKENQIKSFRVRKKEALDYIEGEFTSAKNRVKSVRI